MQNLPWKYNSINRRAKSLTEKGYNRIPKQALQYNPKGKRNVGRQKKRWRDQFHLDDQGIFTVSDASKLMKMNVPATNLQLCSLDLTTLRRMVTENKEHTHTHTHARARARAYMYVCVCLYIYIYVYTG